MRKRFSLLICGILLISSLLFMACPMDSESKETTYSVIGITYLRSPSGSAEPNNDVGTIAPSPSGGPSGTAVSVAITSGKDYYIDEVIVAGQSKGKANPIPVVLVDKDITVEAYFKMLPKDNYKVILEQPEGGTISFTINGNTIEYGEVDATVQLSNTPAKGYMFKAYTAKKADDTAINIEAGGTFKLPKDGATVSGTFEPLAGKTKDELLVAGKDALKSGNYTTAIDAFEAAYKAGAGANAANTETEALVYSTIGKLASVAWSPQVGNFFKERLGLTYYPDTLDALLNTASWFDYYPDNKDGTHYSPQAPLNIPDWLKNKTPYTNSLVTIGGEAVASSASAPLILIANLIDKNTTGLNAALDDAIAAIFNNPSYTEALSRTAKLKDKDPVKLDADIASAFGLSQFFGGDDVYVGWAELELLFGALNLVKGTLLYVDSYNWSYDIGFVKDLPWDESALEQIDTIAANLNKVLPLRTGFMTARGGDYITRSQTAYADALTSIIDVYDYYTGAGSDFFPAAYKNNLTELGTKYKAEAVKARDAIKNGGTFDVPAALLGGQGGQTLTINFGNFFKSGQLTLDKLIKTAGSGTTKAPVFYGFKWGTDGTISSTPITDPKNFDATKYQGFGFMVDPKPITEIIGGGFADGLLAGAGPLPVLDPMTATIAWAVYHWDNGGKEIINSFIGGSQESGSSKE